MSFLEGYLKPYQLTWNPVYQMILKRVNQNVEDRKVNNRTYRDVGVLWYVCFLCLCYTCGVDFHHIVQLFQCNFCNTTYAKPCKVVLDYDGLYTFAMCFLANLLLHCILIRSQSSIIHWLVLFTLWDSRRKIHSIYMGVWNTRFWGLEGNINQSKYYRHKFDKSFERRSHDEVEMALYCRI